MADKPDPGEDAPRAKPKDPTRAKAAKTSAAKAKAAKASADKDSVADKNPGQ